jgi:hypothetical protein
MNTEQTPEPLTDDELRRIVEEGGALDFFDPAEWAAEHMARELLDKRARHLRALSLIRHLLRSRRRWQGEAEFMLRQASNNAKRWGSSEIQLSEARARIAELESALAKANSAAGNLLGAAITFAREANQPPTEPDAYITVKRYFAVSAEGPEWEEPAKVFPAGEEWRVEREEFAAEGGWELLPIVADGDGTRFAATSPTPPLGYIAMAREKNADGPFGILPARNLATDKLSAEMQRERFAKDEDMHVIIAELREVRDA